MSGTRGIGSPARNPSTQPVKESVSSRAADEGTSASQPHSHAIPGSTATQSMRQTSSPVRGRPPEKDDLTAGPSTASQKAEPPVAPQQEDAAQAYIDKYQDELERLSDDFPHHLQEIFVNSALYTHLMDERCSNLVKTISGNLSFF